MKIRVLMLALLALLVVTTTPVQVEAQCLGLEFELPYYAEPDDPDGKPRGPTWGGGPHQWAKDPYVKFMDLNSGSGMDFGNEGKTFLVAAMAEGEVIWADDKKSLEGNLGIQVAVKHPCGWVIRYGHLAGIWQEILDAVEVGETYYVYPGYTIGYAGSSETDNLHLHTELRDGTRDCCEGPNDGGNPVSWHSKILNGYRIYEIRPNELGINDDPNDPGYGTAEVAYNYDGVAVKLSDVSTELGPFGYNYFSFRDFNGQMRNSAYTWLPSDFPCDAVSECDLVKYDGVEFAGKGDLGGGGTLVSDLIFSPENQPQIPQPTSSYPPYIPPADLPPLEGELVQYQSENISFFYRSVLDYIDTNSDWGGWYALLRNAAFDFDAFCFGDFLTRNPDDASNYYIKGYLRDKIGLEAAFILWLEYFRLPITPDNTTTGYLVVDGRKMMVIEWSPAIETDPIVYYVFFDGGGRILCVVGGYSPRGASSGFTYVLEIAASLTVNP